MPADKRFDSRDWATRFSQVSAANLREKTDEVARRLLQLLPGGDPGDLEPPGPPTDLAAFGGVNGAFLFWSPPPDLDVVRYRVKRSTTTGTGYVTIAETPNQTFNDSGLIAGTTYFYVVAAIDDSGNVGPDSNEASAVATGSGGPGTPPLPPFNVVAVPGDGVVDLSWSIGDLTAVSTTVLRGDESGGPYDEVTKGLTGTTFQDDTVLNGEPYFYVLRHVNANGDVSANSAEVTAIPQAGTNPVPSAPTGFTVSPKYQSAFCSWNANPEGDVSSYRINYSTGDTEPVDNGSITVPVGVLSTIVPNLLSARQYTFELRAIDTAGGESNPTAGVVKVILEGPGPSTPPAAPQDFRVHAEGFNSLTFRWTANTEFNLAGYRLIRFQGVGIPQSPSTPGWVAVGPVISANQTQTIYFAADLTNDVAHYFALVAANNSGQSGPFSQIVVGTPSSAGSGPGAGGTFEPPIGGGTGTTPGAFNGDTGLGSLHRAPGAQFDFVIDRSTFTQPRLFASIGAALRDLITQNNMQNKRVAVLLPEKDYVVQREQGSPFDAGVYQIGVRQSLGFQEPLEYPSVAGMQVHLIAPYPGGDTSVAVETAVQQPRKFSIGSITPEGEGFSNGSSTQGKGLFTIAGNTGFNARWGFWFMQFNGSTWASITWGNPAALPHGFLTVYGCNFLQPYHFSNRNSQNPSSGPGFNAQAFVPRFQISTFGVLIDQFHYNVMDCPYTSEHHVYERNSPIGDSFITNSTFSRCGGNVWQHSRRPAESQGSGGEGPDLSNGMFAGTQFWRNILAWRYGRSYWSSGAIEYKAPHRNLDMEDCVFINDNPGCAEAWPPPNLATIATDQFCAPPYNRGGGFAPNDVANGWFISQTGDTGSPPIIEDGHYNGTVRLRNVRVFHRMPQDELINLSTCRGFDAANCVFLHTIQPGHSNRVIGLVRGGNPSESPVAINFIEWTSNNRPDDVLAFRDEYPDEIPVEAISTGTWIYIQPGPGQGTGRVGNGRTGPSFNMNGAVSASTVRLPDSQFGFGALI